MQTSKYIFRSPIFETLKIKLDKTLKYLLNSLPLESLPEYILWYGFLLWFSEDFIQAFVCLRDNK